MSRLALAVATGCGVGYIRVAPGTFGSVLGLLVWAIVPRTALGQGFSIAILSLVGVWSATRAEKHFNRTDPGAIVIDEVAGMLVSLFSIAPVWSSVVTAFLAFRFFDVLKPYPAGRLERLPGGLGIMADDLMAGVYANVATRLAFWLVRLVTG